MDALKKSRTTRAGAQTSVGARIFNLDDYRQFDVGGPTRCWRCGTSQGVGQSFGDGGYVWACGGCPHPAD